jgi:phosphatidylserine decarboxylase
LGVRLATRYTPPVNTPLLAAMSRTIGWLADRRVPRPLRAPIYKGYCRFTGADPSEASLALDAYPSMGAFFVRHLVDGARPIEQAPGKLPSPCDSRIQNISKVTAGTVLQAKGQPYAIRDLLAGVGEEVDLEGGHAWTMYLSPSDYHRVHSPENARMTEVRWVPGSFYSVAPGVLLKRPGVIAGNERAVLRLETSHGPLFLVMVGALNVARIRVVGVEPGQDTKLDHPFARGEEIARFEMGSTVVLVSPPGGLQPESSLSEGDALRLGQWLGNWA